MMTPTARAVALLAGAFPAALLPALATPRLWTVWALYVGAALVLLAVDAAVGLRRFAVETSAPATLCIGDEPGAVAVTLRPARRPAAGGCAAPDKDLSP